ncbi:hypothetical protein CAEBREN_08941 [Caenorhabditis brenneri]|uniref:Uncharacterized protein n=1 Tax=Caenorhabditis brenneri TaxID=135651 RepID=G0NEQ4_CAEBE|nr:hypothetical protein CAEBREN_08941 [Caenorhabditis brenneri]
MMVEELAVERSDEIGRSGSKPKDARIRTVSTSSTGYKLTKPRSDNLLNLLSSGGIHRSIPIQNQFRILGSTGFNAEIAKKKMKSGKSERMHHVLHRNYLRSESQILGSPILPPGVWNTRFPKIKPNKKLEKSMNQENVREMGVGGCSKKQQGVATECGKKKRDTTGKKSGMDRKNEFGVFVTEQDGFIVDTKNNDDSIHLYLKDGTDEERKATKEQYDELKKTRPVKNDKIKFSAKKP